MPQSAIATGAVDVIIAVQDMPRVLLATQPGRSASAQATPPDPDTDALRLAICKILNTRLSHDFSQYKDKTFPLGPPSALSLRMAIHELATNAAKYGALSVPQGTVSVTWAVKPAEGGDSLVLNWIERDGPPVVAPANRGFGTLLIERSLSHDLSGEAQIEFPASGVRASVRVPRSKLEMGTPDADRITV